MVKIPRIIILISLVLFTLACERQKTPPNPPSLPARLSVPHNVRLTAEWKAEGIQPYLCLAGPNGVASWVPGEPSSILKDASGKSAGRQKGWTWFSDDGNRIVLGRLIERAETAGHPAFLIETGVQDNSNRTAPIRYIQRVMTRPPEPPSAPCNMAHIGKSLTQSFLASDYVYEQIAGLLPGGCGGLRQGCCVSTTQQGNMPVNISYCHIGFECSGAVCVPAQPQPELSCGAIGQSCCKNISYDDPNYDTCKDFNNTVCLPWDGDHGTCVACGGIGQAACMPGRVCREGVARNNTCVACGGPGQPCCSNGCSGGGTCSPEAGFTCAVCGGEGQPVCDNGTCNGDLHPDIKGQQVMCTATCGHSHQPACRTQYQVPGGVSSRYRCFGQSQLAATPGPPIAENCSCVPAPSNDRGEDVSDNSGFCLSSQPPAPDRPDPPDCDGSDCTSKHEG